MGKGTQIHNVLKQSFSSTMIKKKRGSSNLESDDEFDDDKITKVK